MGDAGLRPADSCSGQESVNVPFRSSRSDAARSRGSVEERPVHTGKVAGSIPAGTTLFGFSPTTSSVGSTFSYLHRCFDRPVPSESMLTDFPARSFRSGKSFSFPDRQPEPRREASP